MTFELQTLKDTQKIQSTLKEFLIDFGFNEYKVSLFCVALSEAMVNALRYANGGSVTSMYTHNNKGIEVRVDDKGEGMSNLEKCMHDGYTSWHQSLGLGLGVMQRSVDEFIINKSDSTGTSISLKLYNNISLYESTVITQKKENEVFNGDGSINITYDGDVNLTAVLDGAGYGEKANQAIIIVSDCILENKRLTLDVILEKCHGALVAADVSRGVEIAILRLKDEELSYIVLGNTFIKSFPYLYFQTQYGSLGKSFPDRLEVMNYTLEKEFILSLCSDGIEKEFTLESIYQDFSLQTLATHIFNSYNTDDDSTIIMLRRGDTSAK